VDEYLHDPTKRVLRTRGVKLSLLSATVAAFGSNVDSVLGIVSATTGIPQRILTGSERGELASTQDQSNWGARIQERRSKFAIPVIRDLIDRLIDYGALPAPAEYTVMWPEADATSPTETASIVSTLANANKAQAESEGDIVISASEIRETYLGMDPLPDGLALPPDEEVIEEIPVSDEEVEAIRASRPFGQPHPEPGLIWAPTPESPSGDPSTEPPTPTATDSLDTYRLTGAVPDSSRTKPN